jgi:hypothetical protein
LSERQELLVAEVERLVAGVEEQICCRTVRRFLVAVPAAVEELPAVVAVAVKTSDPEQASLGTAGDAAATAVESHWRRL